MTKKELEAKNALLLKRLGEIQELVSEERICGLIHGLDREDMLSEIMRTIGAIQFLSGYKAIGEGGRCA